MNCLFYLFLVFLSFIQPLHPYEPINIETLPILRTHQYPIKPYSNIIISSAHRTGSTLIYNVARFLFENPQNICNSDWDHNKKNLVLKTHNLSNLVFLNNKNPLYLIPIRNPITATISNYRIQLIPPQDLESFVREMFFLQARHLLFIEDLQKNNKNFLVIKYENFNDNLDYLFDLIEKRLLISINNIDRKNIKLGLSKKSVSSSTNHFASFEEFLPSSRFHGKHVAQQDYTPPEELLYWIYYYLDEIKPAFQEYGYFTDSSP